MTLTQTTITVDVLHHPRLADLTVEGGWAGRCVFLKFGEAPTFPEAWDDKPVLLCVNEHLTVFQVSETCGDGVHTEALLEDDEGLYIDRTGKDREPYRERIIAIAKALPPRGENDA